MAKRLFCISYLYILIFALHSCGGDKSIERIEKNLSNDHIFSIDLKEPYYIEKYSNIFDSIRYVPLEETRNSIVGEVTRLEITNDGEYIVLDNLSGSIFRFASDGKFLNNIGFRGPGENEYVSPLDMAYDSFSDKVIVWDRGKKALLVYNLEGKMESKIQLPWTIGTFGVIDQKHLVLYMNNDEALHSREKGYNYKIIDYTGTVIEEFGEYGNEDTDFNPACEGMFYCQEGRCICLPPYSYFMYEVKNDKLVACAKFNFSNCDIPHEWITGSHSDLEKKLKEDSKHIYCIKAFESDKYYLLNIVRKKIIYLCILDKKEKKNRSIGARFLNNVYGLVSNSVISRVKNNEIYMVVDPIEFQRKTELLNLLPDNIDFSEAQLNGNEDDNLLEFDKYRNRVYVDSLRTIKLHLSQKEREFVKKMSNQGNPVLQICTLK